MSTKYNKSFANLNMGALELGLKSAFARITGHMEAIAVRIADEYIASVGYVNAIGEAGNLLVANAIEECAVLLKDGHAMPLKIAYIKIVVCNSKNIC